jgi:ribosomal protein S2
MTNQNVDVLAMTAEDVQLMLAAEVHLGARNVDPNMKQYVHKRAANGTTIGAIFRQMNFVSCLVSDSVFLL